jgi:hypothetical protein
MKAFIFIALTWILCASVWAHGDDDHGDQPHPTAAPSAVISSESASSDFEVLAQMDGELLTIFLNRFADNSPVSKAVLEVESASFKGTLKPSSAGVYQVAAPALSKPGEHALVISLRAGEQSDLLETRLLVAAAEVHTEEKAMTYWWLGLGGALVVLVLVVLARRGVKTK